MDRRRLIRALPALALPSGAYSAEPMWAQPAEQQTVLASLAEALRRRYVFPYMGQRFELRHPSRAPDLARWAPGLEGTPAAALAMLAQLATMPSLPPVVVQQVRALAQLSPSQPRLN